MQIVTLRSGRAMVIRSIRPDDGARLQAAHDRLSEHSRYQRFLAAKPHLSATDTRYLVEVDGLDHVALVATPLEDPEWIVAVGRFIREREDPTIAEFAIVVADSLQGQGLGTEMLERLADAAQERGIERFSATILAENAAVRRLVRQLSGRLPRARRQGGVNEIEFELAS